MSAIPAHIYTDYNSQTRPDMIFERWNTRLQTNGVTDMMLAFGWGDGGGGQPGIIWSSCAVRRIWKGCRG
jgi:hypothetical protein